MSARCLPFLLLVACSGDKTAPTDSAPADSAPADTGQACGDGSPADLEGCVDLDRISSDLNTVAEERTPGSAHWQEVQDLCAQRLADLGFAVELHTYDTGVNVIGTRTGATDPDTQVLISAHYDAVPGCAGADDNASGVAALLESARVLATVDHDRTLVVACWDEEEDGLLGSEAWATEAAARGDQLAAVYVYETIGYRATEPDTQTLPSGFDTVFPDAAAELAARGYTGDFLFYAADEAHAAAADALEAAAAEVDLPLIGVLLPDTLKNSRLASDLRRSDHASFWEVDLPGLFVTDTADFRNAAYHCQGAEDTVDRLDLDFIRANTAATVGATARMLEGSAR